MFKGEVVIVRGAWQYLIVDSDDALVFVVRNFMPFACRLETVEIFIFYVHFTCKAPLL